MKVIEIHARQGALADDRVVDGSEVPDAYAGEPILDDYDVCVVGFSGGKDSVAAVLRLIELGVDRSRIELHHHDIDGRGPAFMDWAVTPIYCQAVADHLGIRMVSSWRQRGFLAEMLKTDDRSKPISFEDDREGGIGQSGGIKGKVETRRKFPQLTANLAVRWCSASLKIDVMDAVLRNSARFQGKKILVVTGERAEESPNRARYAVFSEHRSHAARRPTDHWLPVHNWPEADVWAIMARHGIVPHPAYQLGWSRLSCMSCIFGSPDQWATLRAIYPERFQAIVDRETEFGVTIRKGMTVTQLADRGTCYPTALTQPDLVALAGGNEWNQAIHTNQWEMPAGAFGEGAGPP